MELLDLFARITLDTSGYEEGLEKAANASKNVVSAFTALNSPLDNLKAKLDLKPAMEQLSNAANAIAHPIETFKAKLSEASTALETKRNKLAVLQSTYDSTKQKVADLTAEFNKSAKENGVTSKETQELAQKLKDAEQAAATAKGELEDYAESVKKTGDKSIEASEQSSKFADALKSGFGAAAKVSAAAIGTAAAGIAAITKSAVENYGEYEQLVGGVETLFKDSADVVQGYAANAYKTAGLSANQYMETVTSFSASLLQSLGGNTEAAAEVANKAITDMADNANKMGTDMQSIQNAYQGFAKQNYTMLDNLKLGFGGTKEEMQRLLDTANDYNRQQGINTDYQISSYADIVEAIHVVQTEMGITGTTAAEAASTIQGSLSSVSAAWNNLVTGIADENADFGTLITNFVDSATTALDNLLPRVKVALQGVGELVTELSPVIAEAIPELVDDVLPSILQAAVDLVTALVNALVDNGGTVANTALDVLDMLVDALIDNAYNITDGAVSIITTLVNGVSDRLPDLIPAAVEIVMQVVKGITDNTGELVSAALQLIVSLGAGLLEALPRLIAAVVEIPTTIADSIVNYDWGSVAQSVINSLADSLDSLGKEFQVWLDNTFSGGTVYGGDVANVSSTGLVKNMRENSELVGEEIKKAQEKYKEYYDMGKAVIGQGQSDIAKAFEDGEVLIGESLTGKSYAERYLNASKDIKSGSDNVVEAITTGGENAAEASKKSSEKQKSVLMQSMEALERLYKQRQITEEEYQKRRLEYLEKNRNEESDEWTKYYDSVQTYYEKLADTEQKAAEKAAKEREKNFKTILDAYNKQVTELQKKIDTFADKLTGAYKDFYTFEKDEEGNITSAYATDKMTQAGKNLEEYYNQLLAFQERGIGDDMISQLANFSQEEGIATLEYWNGLTDEQLKNLQAKYAKVTDLSSKVSEIIHSGEAKSAADSFANAIGTAVEQDEQFKEIGSMMLSGIMDGLNSGAIDITEAASRIWAAFGNYFENGGIAIPTDMTASQSYTQTAVTTTAFPTTETASVAPKSQAAETPTTSSGGITVNVEVDIADFNNYTNDDIDTLTNQVIIRVQDEIIKVKGASS